MIDLKAMLVEREDCDAGTVQQLRNALAQGGNQYRTLRDITEVLEKKAETATGAAAKRWQLKLGISLFFLGHLSEAIEHLKREDFDVVLLDSKVPGTKSGDEIYRWINEMRPELASRTVLVLPNASDPAMRIFVDKAKILCFVKPFEAADLLAVVRRVLRQRNAAVSQ